MPNRWNQNAAIRRRQIDAGLDLTFTKLFVPFYVDLVKQISPASLLEVGCGTGHLAAALSPHVNFVVALEPSSGMHEVASQVLSDTSVQLEPVSIEDLRGQTSFDLIVSHLCAQVVADLTSFFAAVLCHMHLQSRFVFSIPHPCFYNDYKRLIPSEEYEYMKEMERTISFTITKEPNAPISGVPYHHRPLHLYFSALAAHGLCVFRFQEIYPSPEVEQEYGAVWRVPRYCTFQCEKVSNVGNGVKH